MVERILAGGILVEAILVGGMLVVGILEEIYITREVTPSHLQTVPLETKYYWSGSAAIKKRCKVPRGRWIHTIVFDTIALAKISFQ